MVELVWLLEHNVWPTQISPLVYLVETKSEHQWLSEPIKSKNFFKVHVLTFTFAYENESQIWRKR